MRFNSYNHKQLVEELIVDVFCLCDKANQLGMDGFREKGFSSINSSFFSFVFLCGGNIQRHTSREVLTPILKQDPDIKLIISENLEKYRGDLDLLTFESVLECISKMILIPVESFGTACELGAFTNLDIDNNKVVAIIDVKHSKDVSFINYGPIQYLRGLGDDRVIEANYIDQGDKKHLLTNSQINSLYKNELITSKVVIKKYYKYNDDNTICNIVDLNSFLYAVLDLACLLGFINSDIVFDFFSHKPFDLSFNIRDSLINCEKEDTKRIIDCVLMIYSDLGFFSKSGNYYFVSQSSILDNANKSNRWVGQILFTKRFTRTDEYLSIKCKAAKVRKILYS